MSAPIAVQESGWRRYHDRSCLKIVVCEGYQVAGYARHSPKTPFSPIALSVPPPLLSALSPPSSRIPQADVTSLRNALLNLAINARDAMPSGGTMLFVSVNATLPADSTARAALGLPEAARPGRHLVLAVEDSGRAAKGVPHSARATPNANTRVTHRVLSGGLPPFSPKHAPGKRALPI